MAKRKYIGYLTKDILSLGDSESGKKYTFQKGQKVIVYKRRIYDYDTMCWTVEYEYHYSDENGKDLVRLDKLLIQDKPL